MSGAATTTVPAAEPSGPPPSPVKAVNPGSLSQWQLIRRRFAQHRLALASFYFIIFIYTVAFFCGFFATTTQDWRELDHAFSPPQLPRFSLEHGIHTYAVSLQIDPVTRKKYYLEDSAIIVPLGFFVRGETWSFYGLFESDVHFFGVDNSRWQESAEGIKPTFYFLGADRYGRDIYSRIIYGARVSLSIGLVGISIAFLLGIAIGGISGYIGGKTDTFIQRLIEIISSFPELPLWLAMAAVMPPTWSPLQVYFAMTIILSLLHWTGLARVVRGKILSLREEDYAVAARLLGASHGRILFRHLVPGFTSHIIVALTMTIPAMILGETSLSFLGLGLRPPVVSWGVMLQDCLNLQVVASYPWLLMPTLAIVGTVLAFNFLGDGLRDAADPYASR